MKREDVEFIFRQGLLIAFAYSVAQLVGRPSAGFVVFFGAWTWFAYKAGELR